MHQMPRQESGAERDKLGHVAHAARNLVQQGLNIAIKTKGQITPGFISPSSFGLVFFFIQCKVP